ncbi:matrixin family metalloprotease [Solicola sp. PLA-1-18]|uniref:matrixin family metalloprotease n=1 Tax=Solicola sp. PLA-1-18 TaxID=3380532 RepID=UPI003B829F62
MAVDSIPRARTRRVAAVLVLALAVACGTLTAAPAQAQRPHDKLAGRASDHSRLVPGAAWDPCRTITYAINTRHLRANAKGKRAFVREVRWSIRQIRRASGLRFRQVADTTAVPQRGVANPEGVDVLVAWARPGKDSDWLTDRRQLGYGGASASAGRLQDGFVLLNASVSHRYPAKRFPGNRKAWNRRVTVLHELSHAVGAGHARGKKQIMYPTLTGKAWRFGAGDAAGMKELGGDRSTCG